MSGELLYLDSSALVKLVLPERESDALLRSLADWPVRLSSELAAVEVVRAARRATTDPAVEQRAMEILSGLHLLKIDSNVLGRAPLLEPRTLRSLDAIHLASALSLGEDLGAVVVYDTLLATAAANLGLRVLTPSP